MFPQLQHTAKFAPVMRKEGMVRSLTVLGCLREESRRRHNSNEAGCPLGGSCVLSLNTRGEVTQQHLQLLCFLNFKSSLVWAFFDVCTADSTIAVCNLCLKRIKRGQNSSRLGTTCLTRHMTTCHASCWQQHLKDQHQKKRPTSPCSSSGISNPTIQPVLSKTCTERNEGIAIGVPS
ncbi:hypothetical protein AB205_0161470, partial [Aquarana catesbeiana]